MKKSSILLTLIIALTFAISSFSTVAFAVSYPVHYHLTDENLEAANAAVANADKTGTTFTIPKDEMRNLIDIYGIASKDDLRVELYVIKPQGGIPNSATSIKTDGTYPTISLDKSGTYRFWILYGNLAYEERDVYMMFTKDNKMDTEGITLKDDGWYDDDGIKRIPVFSFEYEHEDNLTITASGTSEDGVVNRAYTDITFNISHGTLAAKDGLKLEYSSDSTDGEKGTWAAATVDDAEFDESKFTLTSISFTPKKRGYFRVVCTAEADDKDEVKKAYATVYVSKEYTEVKLVDTRLRDFLKNNWKSLIFLGLALLSLIGIVVVALYKPKDAPAKKAVVKEDDQAEIDEGDATEAENAEEESDATEAENAEEESAPVSEDETYEEEAAEDVPEQEETTESAQEITENTETSEINDSSEKSENE